MSEVPGVGAGTGSPETPVTSDDIAAAFPAEAGTPSGPDSSSGSPSEPVSATPPTAESGTDGFTPSESAGPLPFERHKAILEKARTEARAAAEQEWKAKYGWAERYQPEQVTQAVQLAKLLEQDPHRAVAMLQAALAQSDPPKAPEIPQPDLRAEDGTPVYSAPQMQKLLEWQRDQMQSQIEAQYGPVRDRVRFQEVAMRAQQEASQTLTKARAEWPLFTELEGDIKALMVAHDQMALHDAYLAAYREKGLKLQEDKWRQSYEGTVQRKADASRTNTSPRPAGVKPVPLHERDVRDLVEEQFTRMSR